jgi:hypothetical protein
MRRSYFVVLVPLAILAFGAGTLLASGGGKVVDNPDIGRTQSEIEAAQAENSKIFWARLPGWIEEHAKGLDHPENLPRSVILASVPAPHQSLTDAVGAAPVIIEGTVESLSFRGGGDTVGTITVTNPLKGTKASQIEVVWPGGIRPDPGWDDVSLAYLEEAPIVFPGSKLVLFLEPSSSDPDKFSVQLSTGTYYVVDDGVVALEANPFAPASLKLKLDQIRVAATAAEPS